MRSESDGHCLLGDDGYTMGDDGFTMATTSANVGSKKLWKK